MSLDLAAALRAKILGNAPIVALLTAYEGSYPVFTRRPVPPNAPYPMIVVSPDISLTDNDGIRDFRPLIERDIVVYGQNDVPEKYRVVENIAYMLRDLFHRRRDVTISGWSTITINARGPQPAPTDDDQTIARVVMLTIQLAKKN